MEHIIEPQGVDFYVDPKPLTKKEEEEISEYIANHKLMTSKAQLVKNRPISTKKITLV